MSSPLVRTSNIIRASRTFALGVRRNASGFGQKMAAARTPASTSADCQTGFHPPPRVPGDLISESTIRTRDGEKLIIRRFVPPTSSSESHINRCSPCIALTKLYQGTVRHLERRDYLRSVSNLLYPPDTDPRLVVSHFYVIVVSSRSKLMVVVQ